MRRRGLAPALVVLGAAGIAGGALPTWWTVRWAHAMLGEQTAVLTGQQVSPSLLALALVAVAGIGAVAAARGGWRRAIGALIGVVGVLAVIAAVTGTATLPSEVIRDENLQVERVLTGSRTLFGPAVAMFGGLLTAAGGALVAAGFFAGRGMGGRFDRAGPTAGGTAGAIGAAPTASPAGMSGRAPAASSTGDPEPATPVDPDESATALWKSLDSGVDPTAGPVVEPGFGPTANPAAERPGNGSGR